MRGAAVALLSAVVLAGGGCGYTASPDETHVRRTVGRWITAVTAHDNGAACAELSNQLRASMERHLLGEGVSGSCRTWAAKWVSPRHPGSHREARIASLRIHGPRATVVLTARGVPDGVARLVKQNGRWRIDDF